MSDRGRSAADGLALIAVLVALSLLLALTGPFLLSMSHGDSATMDLADRKQVELLSASARDIVLQQAGMTHETVDEYSAADSRDEFPASLDLPAGFESLRRGELSENLLAAETEDLQRRININTASPLLIANLLGLSARLQRDLPEDADELAVDDTTGFPDEGYVVVDRELIHYRRRDGNAFAELERGMLAARGYESAEKHALAKDTVVIDFRVVLALTHSFYHQGDDRRDRRVPLASVDDVSRIDDLGFGAFTPEQMDVLRRYCTVGSVRERSGDWGMPERVFEPVEVGADPWQGRTLRVRSAANIGGGSVLRIRSLDGKHVEYALCWKVDQVGGGTVNMPGTRWGVQLLRPVLQPFTEIDTVVEPLLPHPININTASQEVLAAIMEGVRGGTVGRAHGDRGNQVFSRGEAQSIAGDLRALRGDQDGAQLDEGVFSGAELRPFDSFEDLTKRFFEPRVLATDPAERGRWLRLYRVFESGRPGDLEMGTVPIVFTSAPVVSYRASALLTRGGQTAAREERSGTAVVMPGTSLDLVVSTQRDFEGLFRLDRQAPWFTTLPINLGSWLPFDPAANPPSRAVAQLLPTAVPNLGFGQPRFPTTDGVADAFAPAPAHTPFAFAENNVLVAEESMWSSFDPEGRNVAQEGAYSMFNRGPRSGGTQGGGTAPSPPQTGSRAHQPTFPYTVAGGLVGRHAVSFWFMPKSVGNQMLFDLSANSETRNRISVKIFQNQLVFEVIDEAGIDNNQQAITRVGTSPERTAGSWVVPLSDIDLRPNTWYHVNLSASGNRPSQLSMLIDGVPRDQPKLRTYLTAQIPAYVAPTTPATPFWNDSSKYLQIRVENTQGFPPRGVLRIGLELFEYTALTPSSFLCAYGRGDPVHNSYGGRVARMSLYEFVPSIPVNPSTGRPVVNLGQISGGTNLRVAPPHPRGATVELYGYAVPVYRDFVVQVGAGRLTSALGAFSVARVTNDKTQIVIPLGAGGARPLGTGLDANEVVNIQLGDPIAIRNPQPASERIASSFSMGGGYAVLMQVLVAQWAGQGEGTANFGSISVGGIELIRYGARSGSMLTGVQRGLTLPSLQPIKSREGILFDGTSRKFVCNWRPRVQAQGVPLEELPQWLTYIVPISLPVSGGVLDPSTLGRSEFVQLYPQGGDESDTEIVRYDYTERNWVVRTAGAAWLGAYQGLTDWKNRGMPQATNENVTIQNVPSRTPYPIVQQQGVGYIGYTDKVEVDFPQNQVARVQLQFRGDPLTRTTSHQHQVNSMVLPVQRMELDWGNYGAMSGRAGRNDRIALVGGTQASGTSRPPVEWHTVNWAFRRQDVDAPPSGGAGGGPSTTPVNVEKLGAYPCQFVAFQEPVAQLFVGPAQRNFLQDVRLVDRIVKFPSGELPAAAPENGVFGSTVQKDVPDFGGKLDELLVVQRLAEPVLLDQSFGETAGEFVVRRDLLVTPQGETVVAGGDLTANFNKQGGLVSIDGEIIAYQSVTGVGTQTARFVIAQNGRGLLDPQRRAYAHDEGAMVYFLEHVPAAILSSGISENSSQIVVQDMGNLPRNGGTLLLGGTELMHYTWSTGRQLMEMPVWFEPDDVNAEGRGLLRGRYGTKPISGQAGEPVIWFPFRYWDRYHERADDPELAHFQLTWSLAPVYFKTLYWQEELLDPLVDVHCLVRLDGQGSFADDPEKPGGLLRFTDGDPNQRPNPLHRQASRIEARFMTVYKPGAFNTTTFLAHSWKKAPRVRAVVVDYEGEGRILSERVTAR